MRREEALKELKCRKKGKGIRTKCECPACGRNIQAFEIFQYCPVCGQKIDWSELDD